MVNNEWGEWIKCNVLEILILVFVLILVVKAFSVPVLVETPQEVSKPIPVMEKAAAKITPEVTGVKETLPEKQDGINPVNVSQEDKTPANLTAAPTNTAD